MIVIKTHLEEVLEYKGLADNPYMNLLYIAHFLFKNESDTKKVNTILFTQVKQRPNGMALFNLIKINPTLGLTYKSDTRLNRNSGNQLDIFLYIPNLKNLKDWYELEKDNYLAQHKKAYPDSTGFYAVAPFTGGSISDYVVGDNINKLL